jgi:hypothetical protein
VTGIVAASFWAGATARRDEAAITSFAEDDRCGVDESGGTALIGDLRAARSGIRARGGPARS